MADTDELLRERIKRMQEEIDTNNAAAQRAQAEANFFEKKLAELEKLNPATNHELQAWKDWELMKASYVEIVKYKKLYQEFAAMVSDKQRFKKGLDKMRKMLEKVAPTMEEFEEIFKDMEEGNKEHANSPGWIQLEIPKLEFTKVAEEQPVNAKMHEIRKKIEEFVPVAKKLEDVVNRYVPKEVKEKYAEKVANACGSVSLETPQVEGGN